MPDPKVVDGAIGGERNESGNQHGYVCPACKCGDKLYITASVTAALLPEGCDTSNSDTEWTGDSPAWCGCGWTGEVHELEET